MYHSILVPISFDENRDVSGPLKLARLMASPGATITLLHVVERIPGYAASYITPEILANNRKEIQAELDSLAKELPNAVGVIAQGHAGRGILDWADTHKPDLIIIASHRPGMQDLLLGSTATQVVRHARCAVHVVR